MQSTKENNNLNVSPWLILIILSFGSALVILDKTITNIALPTIITYFGTTLTTASWIATIYVLTNAIFIPVWGKLGGVFGHRKIFTIGFVGFILASMLSGIAWSINSLIFFRALQGTLGAAVIPAAMSIVVDNFKDRKARAQALGIWSSVFAVAIVLGPLIGGPLIDGFSWRSIFYINLPIGLIILLLIFLFVPKSIPGERGKFDYKGAIYLGLALFSLILVLDKGIEWGWLSLESIMFYLLFILFSLLFCSAELNAPSPIVSLKLFKNRNLSAALGTTIITHGIWTGSLLVISLFVQHYLGYNATHAGYIYLPLLIGYSVLSPIGANLSNKFKPRTVISTGLFIGVLGIVVLSAVNSNSTFISLAMPLFVMGAGLGVGSAPINTAVTSSVPHSEVGVASGLLSLGRNVSGSFGIALLTTLIEAGKSYQFVFIVCAVFIALGGFVSLLIKESSTDYHGIEK